MIDRLSKLRKKIVDEKLDGLLITSIPNVTYLTGYSNFLSERETFLLMTKNKQFIFTNSLYIEEIQKMDLGFEIIQITRENPFNKILLEELPKKLNFKKIGFEEKDITVSEYKKFSSTPQGCKIKFVGTKNIIEDLRIIKEPEEIERIQQACRVGDKAFEYILKKIRSGITEKELTFELELFVKKQGFDLSFPAIFAFGADSSVPHHQPTNKKLNKNSIVLLDFGVKINNYCSDMTRTIFFGKASDKQKKMYYAVLTAQKKAFDLLVQKCHPELDSGSISHGIPDQVRNDINAQQVDKVARDYIISQGYPNIPHSLGHGIGLEVHESPRLSPVSKDNLEQDTVFSLEPGIYEPGFGGIRIEDLVVIEQNGPRYLTQPSKHLIEL